MAPICLSDLIDSKKADKGDFFKAEGVLLANFGLDKLNEARNNLIWKRVIDERWSKSRFWEVFNAFLLKVKYPAFTVADFFEHAAQSILYGKKWMERELSKDPDALKRMDIYELEGVRLYRYHDGQIFNGPRKVQINGEMILSKINSLKLELINLDTQIRDLESAIETDEEFLSMPAEKQEMISEIRSGYFTKPIPGIPTTVKGWIEHSTAELNRNRKKVGDLRARFNEVSTELNNQNQ